jgi:hypothetical protein
MAANIHTHIQNTRPNLGLYTQRFTSPLSLIHVQTQSVLYGWSHMYVGNDMVGVVTSTTKKKLKTWNSWIFSLTNIMKTMTVNFVNDVLATILKYGVSPNPSCEMKGTKYLSFTVSYKYCFVWRNNSTLIVTSMKNCNLKMTHPVLLHNQTKSWRVFNKNISDR